MEYARNVLGMKQAGLEETDPDAPMLLINRLSCSLVGTRQAVIIRPGTLAHRAYGSEASVEQFACNYGVNEAYRESVSTGGLRVSGTDDNGAIRLFELAEHPFFVAALFVPQSSSSPGSPHPLVAAFVRAALAFGESRR